MRMPFPAKGKNLTWSFEEQPPGSYREGENVRGQEPGTRRIRGSQRPGLSKYCPGPAVLLNTKIAEGGEIVYDQKIVDYANLADASITTEFNKFVPSQGKMRGIRVNPRNGHLISLAGDQTIAIHTPDGVLVETIPVPCADGAHILRPLEVDSTGAIYTSVAEGGDHKTAKMFCFVLQPGLEQDEYRVLWEIEPEAFITGLDVVGGLIYTVQTDPDVRKAGCVVYDLIESANPILERVFFVPYPARHIRVKADGAIIVSAPADTGRQTNPKYPDLSFVGVDWRPERDILESDPVEVWAHYKAADIGSLDITGRESDEQNFVQRWKDSSGNERHLFAHPSHSPPEYRPNGFDGSPEVWFNGVDMALRGLGNDDLRDRGSRTMLPMHEFTAFAVMIVCKPVIKGAMGALISQKVNWTKDPLSSPTVVNGSANAIGIVVNRREDLDPTLGVQAGYASVFTVPNDHVDGGPGITSEQGHGKDEHPHAGHFSKYTATGTPTPLPYTDSTDIQVGACCIGWISDGSAEAEVSGATKSVFNVNGVPQDRWRSAMFFHEDPTEVGVSTGEPSWGFFEGSIKEIIILRITAFGTPFEPGYPSEAGGTWTVDTTKGSVAWVAASDTIWEKMTGYMMRKYGIGFAIDSGTNDPSGLEYRLNPSVLGGDAAAVSTYVHPYGNSVGAPISLHPGGWPSAPGRAGTQADTNQLNTTLDILVKYEAAEPGNVVWIQFSGGYHGHGLGLYLPDATDEIDDVFTCGRDGVARIHDLGATFQITGRAFRTIYPSVAQSELGPHDFLSRDEYMMLTRDEFDHFYVPIIMDFVGATSHLLGFGLAVYATDGDRIVTYRADPADAADKDQGCFAVAIPRTIPDFEGDLAADTERAEFAFLATDDESLDGLVLDLEVFRKVRLVSVTPVTPLVSPRRRIGLVVSNGSIRKFDTVAFSAPATNPTILDAGSPYIQGVTYLSRRFWTDGVGNYATFDPRTDVVKLWEAERGQMPNSARLIAIWQDRMVLAHFGGGDEIAFSKRGDPFDWDEGPASQTRAQAWSINLVELAGASPGIIQSLMPISDDLMIVGTEGPPGIHRFTGDGLAGGRIHKVSGLFGTAFGQPWTVDPHERPVFMTNEGGICRLTAGGLGIERLSRDTLEQELRDIDFSTFHVRLEWSKEDEGIYIMLVPFGAGGALVTHWFWDARLDAFHPITFKSADVQPGCLFTVDGDLAADRNTLMGCEDGHLRKWDVSAVRDDLDSLGADVDIGSFVTLGPWVPDPDADLEWEFSEFRAILGRTSGPLHYEIFGVNAPDDPLEAGTGVQGTWEAGVNPTHFRRVRGNFMYLRVRGEPGTPWTIESLRVKVAAFGEMRRRTVV